MIHTIVGPMYGGKSTTLIKYYEKIWNKSKIKCFKPKIDDREDGLYSRELGSIPAIGINDLKEIYNYIDENVRTIFIDEAQFLTGDVRVIEKISMVYDIDVYVCGLPKSADLTPFGLMPFIMSISDVIEYSKAVCYDCNKEANNTYYEGEKDEIKVGNEGYFPLCDRCFQKRMGGSKKLGLFLEK